MTIIEFLLARIDETEALAADATQGRWGIEWAMTQPPKPLGITAHDTDRRFVGVVAQAGDHRPTEDLAFIRHQQPNHVIAECEAKRRIVELHAPGDWRPFPPECPVCEDGVWHGSVSHAPSPCDTIRALASVYADHPDFDPAWAVP